MEDFLLSAIRDNWPERLNEVGKPDNIKVSEWIKKGDFEFHTPITNSDTFSLANYSNSFLYVNAFEIEKVACASLETIISIEHKRVNNKSLAWLIVMLYYSAFYAAHAVMRCMGFLCIHLDRDTVNAIDKNIRIFGSGVNQTPNTGYYLIHFDSSNKVLNFKRSTNNKGSHQFLWQSLQEQIDRLVNQLATRSQYHQNVILSLSNFRDILCLRGNVSGNWLSVIRNEVNYKHSFGVWYPNKVKKRRSKSNLLLNLNFNQPLSQINLDNISQEEEIYVFTNATCFLTLLMIKVCDDLIDRNSRNKSWLNKNYSYLLNQVDMNFNFLNT